MVSTTCRYWYKGVCMIKTITLKDGTLKHRLDGWTGYQNPSEPITKTKWYKDGTKYWEVSTPSKSRPGKFNTYLVKFDGTYSCTCLGYTYRRKCKHTNFISESFRTKYRGRAGARVV